MSWMPCISPRSECITAAFSLVQTVLLGVLIGFAHFLSRGGTDGGVGKAG